MTQVKKQKSFKIPILFMVFNRVEQTKKVFQAIRDIKPEVLYIASDGARNTEEEKTIKVIRSIFEKNIDWDCKLDTLYRNKNLGCREACSSAIDWFFENEEMGIVLEDDCLPNYSFFYFCEELLHKYKHDTRIGMIAGNCSYQVNGVAADYFFSKYPQLWGWATWRRAWNFYDVNFSSLEKFIQLNGFSSILYSEKEAYYWKNCFKEFSKNLIDTWDFQLLISFWSQSMLCVVPAKNLVSNIGFGDGATHTHDGNSELSNALTYELKSPINHPELVIPNKNFDNLLLHKEFLPSLRSKIIYKLKKILW